MTVRNWLILGGALTLAACAPAPESAGACAPPPPENRGPENSAKAVRPGYPATRISDAGRTTDLLFNSGITLQWISWDWRGQAHAGWQGETIVITAEQDAAAAPEGVRDLAPGRLSMHGYVKEIGPFHFIFNGTILIEDAPDTGRHCLREGDMEFRITQNRKYWRLRDMEACGDGLTDYVDIYF